MENPQQYDELLIKYLANELTAEQQVFVQSWIKASEPNGEHFKKLEEVWNLAAATHTLDQLLNMNMDEKWNRFKQEVTAKEAKIISIDQQEEWNRENRQEERRGRHSIVYKLIVSAAIAASVLLFISLGWNFSKNNKQEMPVVQKTEEKAGGLTARLRHEINTSGKVKRLELLDGSVITLSDNSEVSFEEPFTGNRREITLRGKAYFKVTKDASKPFTVISGDISTTALGTEFSVTAFKNTNRITVRLYEGKVVVKPLVHRNLNMKEDVYLLPGQGFVYDSRIIVERKTFKLNAGATPEEVMNTELTSDDPSIPQNQKGSWFMFNNQSLEQVLDQLAAIYDVKIIYDKKDVQHVYFTRKFDKSVSVEAILKEIATLNNLRIAKKDSTFIISR